MSKNLHKAGVVFEEDLEGGLRNSLRRAGDEFFQSLRVVGIVADTLGRCNYQVIFQPSPGRLPANIVAGVV